MAFSIIILDILVIGSAYGYLWKLDNSFKISSITYIFTDNDNVKD